MVNQMKLDAVDMLTQETFATLQKEYFAQNRPYYVAFLTENDRLYQFDGLQFLGIILQSTDAWRNPATNCVFTIEAVEIYKTSPDCPKLQIFQRSHGILQSDHWLPMIWNAVDCDQKQRIACMLKYGDALKKEDLREAKKIYHSAADLGSHSACITLRECCEKGGDMQGALYWADRELQLDPSEEKIHMCLDYALQLELPKYILKYSEQGNQCGSLLCRLYLILLLETGSVRGIEKDAERAIELRKKLPPELQNLPCNQIWEQFFS